MTWEQAEAAGLVCLPAAGYRGGSHVYGVGDLGYYRSSTASDERYAYFVYFISSNVSPGLSEYRNLGFSVRLVTDVE